MRFHRCFFDDFWSEKQRINAKSERSKGSGLARSIRRKIYAVIAVELVARGEIFVQLCRRTCEDGFAYGSYSSIDIHIHIPPMIETRRGIM